MPNAFESPGTASFLLKWRTLQNVGHWLKIPVFDLIIKVFEIGKVRPGIKPRRRIFSRAAVRSQGSHDHPYTADMNVTLTGGGGARIFMRDKGNRSHVDRALNIKSGI